MAKVYVKVDDQNRVTAVNSDVFLANTTGWVQVDEGEGDKYIHAQGNYLDAPLYDEQGELAYQCVNGKVQRLA